MKPMFPAMVVNQFHEKPQTRWKYDLILGMNFQMSIIGFISQLSPWVRIENLFVEAQEQKP